MTSSESPPKILGVETRERLAGALRSWSCAFGRLSVSITENGGSMARPLCEARIGGKTVALGALQADCVEAIERELLAIRAAIPGPRHPLDELGEPCAGCGRRSRVTTAGCDHCEYEDK